ncbi:DUF421 domain-containing protein [Alkalicoccobacillus murimartini]|uniref:Uncharacterized membrane protein YcaP (DUF421 family) n=1 Tax=Alkalicoccobacillus murimartini TaxID=171685 RepID=A0ABT9YKA9_9BACI|nr:DUF421 domain-containing protein [Alkalicoccobacillus murimartini]MDQ0207464.1 uncharacterized membrane protein YcaP (DUF421 family) [Alkalicoccobacillus murimartini]
MEAILIALLRTAIVFFMILFFFRLTGKKDIGEISVLDIVVTLLIVDIAVIMIEDTNIPILKGLAPVLLLFAIQYTFSRLSLKNQKFRDIVDGRPVLIIREGELQQENMKKQSYNLDDVLLQLRTKDIFDIREVEYALLETSGALSVYKKGDQYPFSLPFILDGMVQEEHLSILGKSSDWLKKELEARGYSNFEDVFYCGFTKEKYLYIAPRITDQS